MSNCTMLDEDMIVIMVFNKLSGKAYEWFHSKTQHAELMCSALQEELLNMSEAREDTVS